MKQIGDLKISISCLHEEIQNDINQLDEILQKTASSRAFGDFKGKLLAYGWINIIMKGHMMDWVG
jgi:hypothetical protein